MKIALSLLIVSSFIAVAVFGVLVMNHGVSGHGGCIGAAAQGAPCPDKDPLGFIAFHLAAFQKFSTATVNVSAALLLLIAFVFLALAMFRDVVGRSLAAPTPAFTSRIAQSDILEFISHAPFVRWLTLTQRRDFSAVL